LDLIFYDQIFPLWVYEDKGKFLQKLFLVIHFISKVIQTKIRKEKGKKFYKGREGRRHHFNPGSENGLQPNSLPSPNHYFFSPSVADRATPPIIPPRDFETNTVSS
jgi:hypothetical protein